MAKKLSAAAAGAALAASPVVTPAAPIPAAPAAPVASAAPARASRKKAGSAAAPASSGRVVIDRSAFKYAVWIGTSARPKLWLKFLNELGPALGGIPPNKLNNVHVAEIKRVNLKITPTLED